jgi:hypothetical protein
MKSFAAKPRTGTDVQLSKSNDDCLAAAQIERDPASLWHATVFALLLALCGCPIQPGSVAPRDPKVIAGLDLSFPYRPTAGDASVSIAVPQDGFGSFAFRVAPPAAGPMPELLLSHDLTADRLAVSVYQVMPVATDCRSAAYTDETGVSSPALPLPRALLPLAVHHGRVDLTEAHRPDQPAQTFGSSPAQRVMIWVDVHAKSGAATGTVSGDVQVVGSDGDHVASIGVTIAIDNFEMPAVPTVQIAAAMDWEALESSFQSSFRGLTPRLIDRVDPHDAAAIRTLDQLVQTAHDNRVGVYVPAIRPVVKWPVDSGPLCDWGPFDRVVAPWLDGTGMSDRRPVGFWPLPSAPSLGQFDPASQTMYWTAVATHFRGLSWPVQAVLPIESARNEPYSVVTSQARAVFAAQPPVRMLIPIRQDRFAIQTGTPDEPNGLAMSPRIVTRTSGEIASCSLLNLPPSPGSSYWLAAEPRMATEQDLRSVAWLAYLRRATIVQWGDPLQGPAAWFVPGTPFGIDGPVETIELKWARQAEQDYEYLVRSTQRGRRGLAVKLCRLVTRPIELQPTQGADPEFSLICGSDDPSGCEQARRLLVGSDRLPKSQPNEDAIRWTIDHQQVTVVPTGVRWSWTTPAIDAPSGTPPDAEADLSVDDGHHISAEVTADVYHPLASEAYPDHFAWATASHGWRFRPQPSAVPPAAGGEVHRAAVDGSFDLDRIDPHDPGSVELEYTDGFSKQITPVALNLPVATTERRTRPVSLDGSLDDWSDEDALNLDRPLVKMLSRTTVRQQAVTAAALPASVYSGWSDKDFFVAFRVGGVCSQEGRTARNFVDYDDGKAWGDDVCELMIQPVYADDTTGPVTHVVCTPGGITVEHKAGDGPDSRWTAAEVGGIRIARTIDPKTRLWRAELAIPWRELVTGGRGRPGLLRFNFVQHRHDTGESASWAGPLYESRQPGMAGLLVVRESAGTGGR